MVLSLICLLNKSEVENPGVTLHVADVGMHGRRERHQSQAFREPRVIAQADLVRDGGFLGLHRALQRLARQGALDGIVIDPARCRSCGFIFAEDKLVKPGKCPACRGTRMYEAQIRIDPRD